MIGFATINSEGFNGTTGGNGGIVTRASTLDEIYTFVNTNKGNDKKILIITKSIESSETFQFLFKNGSNLTIRGEGDVKLKKFNIRKKDEN